MTHLPLSSVVPWLAFSILVVSILCFGSPTNAIGGNETDRLALLEFKAKIIHDPFMILSSWNDSIHICLWRGVTCGHRHRRITELLLESLQLVGGISPFIGNLSFLRFLSLQNNSISHGIPPEIGRLHRLEVLNLSNNSIGGRIPTNISSCTNLKRLVLDSSQLVGEVPVELGSLARLRSLVAGYNQLSGSISPFLGNLSSIEFLLFPHNSLSGRIPDALGQLTDLTTFILDGNQLSGSIPPSIFNLSSIIALDVAANLMEGTLPFDVGITLPNLQFFDTAFNQFTGSIPPSISNSSNMQQIHLVSNRFIGSVPSLEKLHRLTRFNIANNQLGSGADDLNFLYSLANATSLEMLLISKNNFGGHLPECISNFSSTIIGFQVGGNNIVGRIPNGITNLVNLQTLRLGNNHFSGNIPLDIGKLQSLQILTAYKNNLSGNIPSSVGNLTRLLLLALHGNNLHGSIPSGLANCQYLNGLYLFDNNLGGIIPPQVVGLSSLTTVLDLSSNRLTGPLPIEVGNLKNLVAFSVGENMLSGEIPKDLGNSVMLEILFLGGNFFQGIIPSSFGSLRGLQELDLSRNNLSGKIPDFFVSFKFLYLLNLSYNDFEGLVPTEGVFKNSSATFVMGNNKLCGGIIELHLPKCNFRELKKTKLTFSMKSIIFIVCGLLGVFSMLFSLFLCWLRNKRAEPSSNSSRNLFLNLSYQSLLKATDGFSSTNLLGVGSFGSVYKGIINEGQTTIAVKVLNLLRHGASKSFLAECEALRNIRHRNLVSVLTVCSSVNYQGNDFKALVYEFMVNGSLENWLHPIANEDEAQHEHRNLNLLQRLNIAIDVANALEYLHFHCQTPIFHCDLKPSNILLNDEMIGHVGDFGLARFSVGAYHTTLTNQSSSIGIRGTIGYTAPEYGMGNEVSSLGDVYSYGILLLEMFTGKRPTADMFRGSLNLHSFVKEALPQGVLDIADPILFEEREERATVQNSYNNSIARRSKIRECLISTYRIGVVCSAEQPGERMNIVDVVAELHLIKNKLVGMKMH